MKQPSSFNRLTNIVSTTGAKVSTDTIIDYLNFLQATWLFFSLENYASKLVEKISNRKYYFIDQWAAELIPNRPGDLVIGKYSCHLIKKEI